MRSATLCTPFQVKGNILSFKLSAIFVTDFSFVREIVFELFAKKNPLSLRPQLPKKNRYRYWTFFISMEVCAAV